MSLKGNLTFHNLYKNPDPDLTPGVIRFMSRAGLGHTLADRHFVVAACLPNGDVVGVSTFRKLLVPHLNNNHVFECKLHVEEENDELSMQVLSKSAEFLYATGLQESVVGIMMVVEDKGTAARTLWRRAIWPETGFVLMGFTSAGNPIFIHYFKSVRI
ncbi:MAG TPA: hypothetical protein VG737_06640 [Cyclobacteriaceae bacterium]|nr:hypothetical protein [Cyclobacteriaceae bacterium]